MAIAKIAISHLSVTVGRDGDVLARILHARVENDESVRAAAASVEK